MRHWKYCMYSCFCVCVVICNQQGFSLPHQIIKIIFSNFGHDFYVCCCEEFKESLRLENVNYKT